MPGHTSMDPCDLSVTLASRMALIKPHPVLPALASFDLNIKKFSEICNDACMQKLNEVSLREAVVSFGDCARELNDLDEAIKGCGVPESIKNLKESILSKVRKTASNQAWLLQPSSQRSEALMSTESVNAEIGALIESVRDEVDKANVIDNSESVRLLSDRLKVLSENSRTDTSLPTSNDFKKLMTAQIALREKVNKLSTNFPVLEKQMFDSMEQSIIVFKEAKTLMGKI
jgi:hypothetical protein